jgi:hypothetical protein
MNIEGSAFRFGGGPGLPNREIGGVLRRGLGGLLAFVTGWGVKVGFASGICGTSTSSSSTPSLCGTSGLRLGGASDDIGYFFLGSFVAAVSSGTGVALFGLPPVRARSLSSLFWNDLSTVEFSCLVRASGGLGVLWTLLILAVAGAALVC